jgi:hypothetical protein
LGISPSPPRAPPLPVRDGIGGRDLDVTGAAGVSEGAAAAAASMGTLAHRPDEENHSPLEPPPPLWSPEAEAVHDIIEISWSGMRIRVGLRVSILDVTPVGPGDL